MALATSERRELIVLSAYVVLVLLAVVAAYLGSDKPSVPILVIWLAGAAALGLVTGFTTGASQKAGAAEQLMGFISGGILVPILGAVASLLKQPETTTSVITITNPPTEMHPLWVAGSFFALYSIFAIIGIVLGVRRRNETKDGGINLTPP